RSAGRPRGVAAGATRRSGRGVPVRRIRLQRQPPRVSQSSGAAGVAGVGGRMYPVRFKLAHCVALLALALSFASSLRAAELQAGPTDYLSKLAELKPGDALLLSPGEYQGGLPLHGLHGKPKAPITIASADTSKPAIFVGHPGRNTISLRNASHL